MRAYADSMLVCLHTELALLCVLLAGQLGVPDEVLAAAASAYVLPGSAGICEASGEATTTAQHLIRFQAPATLCWDGVEQMLIRQADLETVSFAHKPVWSGTCTAW
jgi:hypothetical protein